MIGLCIIISQTSYTYGCRQTVVYCTDTIWALKRCSNDKLLLYSNLMNVNERCYAKIIEERDCSDYYFDEWQACSGVNGVLLWALQYCEDQQENGND